MTTSAIGGGADTVARILAPGMTANLGQQVVIDNRLTGVATADYFVKAPPDGYNYLLYNNTVWVGPLLENVNYDAVRDFMPVTLVAQSPNILVVHPALPVYKVKDLIALAKAKPGALDYATGATGSSNHIAGELFQSMAKVKLTRIPYKNGSLQATDLLSGYVQIMFASASMTPYIKSGRLRGVAVASAQPTALFPGLPTIASAGLPGYESGSYYVVFAPVKTPEPMIAKINQEAVRFLKTPEAKDRFLNAGMEAVGSTPAELGALIKADIARLSKVIKDANIREN
jgi:tripartite-type tricarboxylate transporter receptor subunit TctC